MGNRVDIKITFKCNNHCDFCAQGNKRDTVTQLTQEQVEKDLLDAASKGSDGVTFTGGEPTLHPQLLDFVKFAREHGYKNIQIQTNGRTFLYRDFLKKLYDAGVTELCPSLHGACAETHEGLTHAKGSFIQTVSGIMNAKKLGMKVITNTVVTTKNYTEFPKMAALFVSLGVSQFQFAFVHIIGTAETNKKWLVPRKTDVLPYIKQGLDIGLRAGLCCYTEAIPFCLMKGYEECVAEQIIPEGPVFDGNVHLENYSDYRKNIGKAKAPSCEKCIYFSKCEGPWREYPELYGWDEFRPVTE
ncbi:MAG: radical SAM protein [Elusimicrobiales bacterium]|nr:radical SAM protein [Elusimicrobiales bacterium]